MNLNPGIWEAINSHGLHKLYFVENNNIGLVKNEGKTSDLIWYKYIGQRTDKNGIMEGMFMMMITNKVQDESQELWNFSIENISQFEELEIKDNLIFQKKVKIEQYLIVSNFINGRAKGDGAIYFSNGDYFIGTVDDETMNRGILTMKNGNTYEGSFSNNKYEGKGTLKSKAGAMYTGDLINGKAHGKGIMIYVDGSTYFGEWHESKPHGKGIYKNKKGTEFEVCYYHGLKLELPSKKV